MENLIIIEAPFNLGLKQFSHNQPGVNKLPAWLKQHGLYDLLKPQKILHVTAPSYAMQLDEQCGVLNADAIVSYSVKLATEITAAITSSQFPLIIGGDCSILLGCTLGLKSIGNYGLFFLDGHTDYVLPPLSETKAVAGMDLAIVSGNGPSKLTDINSLKPYISQENIFAAGNRCLEIEYVKLIQNSSINCYDLEKLRKKGLGNIVEKFLSKVEENDLDGFWIHLDVDVLNNKLMPCVDSPKPGGLSYEELKGILIPLLTSPKAIGINVTILDPNLDPDGRYTKILITELCTLFPRKEK